MALYRNKTTEEGFKVNYWIVQSVSIDRSKEQAEIAMIPYVSQAAKAKGRKPIDSEKVVVRVRDIVYPRKEYGETMMHYTDFFSPKALEDKGLYAVAYEYIKQHEPQFKEAKDV